MKLIIYLLMLLTPLVHAIETSKTELTPLANIQSTDWNLGGYFNISNSSGRLEDATEINTSIAAKYFLIDRVGLGLSFGLSSGGNEDTVASFGPTASYFFWQSEKLTSRLDLGFRFGLTDATVNSFIQTGLGLDYFILPSVAAGPTLFFNHYMGSRRNYNIYGIALQLGVFI